VTERHFTVVPRADGSSRICYEQVRADESHDLCSALIPPGTHCVSEHLPEPCPGVNIKVTTPVKKTNTLALRAERGVCAKPWISPSADRGDALQLNTVSSHHSSVQAQRARHTEDF